MVFIMKDRFYNVLESDKTFFDVVLKGLEEIRRPIYFLMWFVVYGVVKLYLLFINSYLLPLVSFLYEMVCLFVEFLNAYE